MALLLPVQPVGWRDAIREPCGGGRRRGPVEAALIDAHDAIAVRIGERTKEHLIDDREDGGVAADSGASVRRTASAKPGLRRNPRMLCLMSRRTPSIDSIIGTVIVRLLIAACGGTPT
ncbi:MAG TPA: hypothetical protein VFB99_19365 [Vicinamibacterales bacterium]|nr:hypothetical protein [Vicinamibacterales bacterium]